MPPSSLPVRPTVNGAAFCATVAIGFAGGVMLGAVLGGAPGTVTEKLSIARPSSAPVASTSVQRMKNVAPFGIDNPVMVEEIAVRLPAALPSSAPAVPAVTGGLKSRAFASRYVPVDKSVALTLY